MSDSPQGDRGYALRESIGHIADRTNVGSMFGLEYPAEGEAESASVTEAVSCGFFTWALGAKKVARKDHIRVCAEMNLETLAKRAKQSAE